jgi:hypothetical protein
MMVGYLTWCTTRRDKTSVIANALENDAILTTSLTTIIKTYPDTNTQFFY